MGMSKTRGCPKRCDSGIDNKQDVIKIQYYLAVLALRFFVCLAIKLIEIILSVNRNGSEKIHSNEIDIQNYFSRFHACIYLCIHIHVQGTYVNSFILKVMTEAP